MNERVVAVVVHYGERAVTERCVESLGRAGVGAVVVDNASPAADSPAEAAPGVDLLRPGRNLGYAAGANLGLRRAFERAPFALVLNNDVTVESPAFASTLADRLEGDATIGIAGPLVLGPDGEPQPTVEEWPSLWRALRLAAGRRPPAAPGEEADVEAVNGVCLMLRREAFEATGGFDERYFMYGEEADLCRRGASAGFRTVFVPVASVVHDHAPGEVRGDAGERVRVNYVRFCRDHRNGLSATLVAVLFLLSSVVRRRRPRALARSLATAFGPDLGSGREERFLNALDRIVVPALIVLWMVLLAFASSFSPTLRDIGSSGKYLAVVLLLAVELPRIALRRGAYLRELRPGAPHAVAAAFVAVAVLSAGWSPTPQHSLKFAVSLGLLFTALLLAPWRIARRPGGWGSLATSVLAAVGAITVGNALAVAVFGGDAFSTSVGGASRFRGFLESPNEIGAYCFVAGLALWRLAPTARLGFRRNVGAWSVAALFVAEIVLSGTRAAVALLVVIAAVYVAGVRLDTRAVVPAIVGIVAACVLGTALVVSPAVAGLNWPSVLRPSTFTTLGGRTEAWAAAGTWIARRPLAGFGIGSERLLIATSRADGERLYQECLDAHPGDVERVTVPTCDREVPRSKRLYTFVGDYAHNSYLGLAVQLGAVALAGMVLLMLLGLRRVARLLPEERAIGAATLAAVLGGALWAMLSTYLWNPGNVVAGPFWLVFVIGLALAAAVVDAGRVRPS